MTDTSNMSNTSKKAKPRISHNRRKSNRREFIRSAALTAGVISLSLAGLYPVLSGASNRLRPPGAIKKRKDEQKFFAACIKCGQCVQVCPVDAIKLSDIDEGVGLGIPYIDAREQACDFSCDGLQCVLACPTGALTHHLNYPADTRMGLARLDKPEACLAVQGKGFKGQARGADFKGVLRYSAIDRWHAIPVAQHPYDLELCNLCVRQCPIEISIAQCVTKNKKLAEEKKAGTLARVAEEFGNECPPKHAIKLQAIKRTDDQGNTKLSMTPTILDGCVGCGVCEMICPLENAPAIVVDSDKETNWS